MLKILPAYPQMIYSYVKNTQNLRLMFAVIFGNYDMPKNLHLLIIIIIIILVWKGYSLAAAEYVRIFS